LNYIQSCFLMTWNQQKLYQPYTLILLRCAYNIIIMYYVHNIMNLQKSYITFFYTRKVITCMRRVCGTSYWPNRYYNFDKIVSWGSDLRTWTNTYFMSNWEAFGGDSCCASRSVTTVIVCLDISIILCIYYLQYLHSIYCRLT